MNIREFAIPTLSALALFAAGCTAGGDTDTGTALPLRGQSQAWWQTLLFF